MLRVGGGSTSERRSRRGRGISGPPRLLRRALGAAACAVALLAPTAAAGPVVKVDGARLVDGAGRQIQLRGVNRSGTEYACSVAGQPGARGYSIFDGPRYDGPNLEQPQWMFDAMRSWGITAVRIPLSEHCWLGDVPSLNPAFSGAAYRQAIERYVDQLGEHGIAAILSLHVVGPDAAPNLAGELLPMPDADNAATFWAQVAGVFKSRTHVLYDAFNEPHLWEIADDAQRWACWRDGCQIDPQGAAPPYQTAGMRDIVNAIRSAGSTQPIMLGGLGFASLLQRWREHLPADPANALVASFHNYPPPGGGCTDAVCWDATIDAIRLGGHPVVTGELGQYDCNHDYLRRYLDWADTHGQISYLAWTWNETNAPSSWTCAGPSVITSYDGTPTQTFGATYRAHLLARQAAENPPAQPPITALPPTPTPTVTPRPRPGPPPAARPRSLRRHAIVGGNRRFSIATGATNPSGPCVSRNRRAAVWVTVALKRVSGRRAHRRFSVRRLNILVDGRRQGHVIKKNVPRILPSGVLRWKAKTRAGKPFKAGSRHVGSIELISSHRNRRGQTVVRRTRLSIPFFVCAHQG